MQYVGKSGETLTLTLENMSFGPAAVGRVKTKDSDKFVVFVEGAMPGEEVEVRLVKIHKNYAESELIRVLKPSPSRIVPPCPVFERCGGCQWQHLSYDAQIAAKKETLLHQLSRTAGITREDLEAKLVIYGAKNPLGYRSRMQVHGDANGIGFFAKNSHDIVAVDRCVVAHADIQKTWTEFLTTRPLAEMAEKTGQFKVEWLRKDNGEVLEAVNRKHGALGFTQVNAEQNEVLKSVVKKLATTGTTRKNSLMLELYGGDGNLTDGLVEHFNTIVSVDNAPTIASATSNDDSDSGSAGSARKTHDPVKLKGQLPKGRTFIQQNTDSFLVDQRWMEWGIRRFDVVLADPPRAGLERATKLLARMAAPRVVLVSCDPTTLARDLSDLLKSYEIASLHLIDMFPQTYHMETVVELVAR